MIDTTEIICWTDNNDVQHYDIKGNGQKFCDENGIEPDFIFKRNDDIIYTDRKEQDLFMKEAYNYGFAFSDYNRTVRLNDGTKAKFIGFHSRNHKYKCILRRVQDGRLIKCTPLFVIQHLI